MTYLTENQIRALSAREPSLGSLIAGGLVIALMFSIGLWAVAPDVVYQLSFADRSTVPGQIVECEVMETSAGLAKLHLRYRYVVDGTAYFGTRWRTTRWPQSLPAARKIATALPVGTEVPVRYSTADPADSVLAGRLSNRPFFYLWTSFIGLGFAVWILTVRQYLRRRHERELLSLIDRPSASRGTADPGEA